MSDLTPENKTTPPEASQNDAIDQSRRKVTGAALGVSAVFTLASRPVWANQCSISGMASGNLSAPGKVTCGGCTPGYWKVCGHLGSWAAAGYSPSQSFNVVFGVNEYKDCNSIDYTLLDVLYLTGGSRVCGDENDNKNNKPAHPGVDPTGTCGNSNNGNGGGNLYSPDLGGDPISENLGFHAVAALLNAGHDSVNYGYEPGDIINMFKNNYLTNGAALKDTFDMLNNRGCPLGLDPDNRNKS
ncbi:hypothetical protein [Thiobacillus sp.]